MSILVFALIFSCQAMCISDTSTVSFQLFKIYFKVRKPVSLLLFHSVISTIVRARLDQELDLKTQHSNML